MNIWGIISQIFFMICLVPQPIKTFIKKDVSGVSVLMWLLQGCGYIFGLAYGIEIKQLPLIIGCLFGLFVSCIFVVLYSKYRSNNHV